MRTFRFNKLVRDNIVPIIEAEGGRVQARRVDADEWYDAIVKKHQEEINEFISNPSVEEAADVCEIFDAFIDDYGTATGWSEMNDVMDDFFKKVDSAEGLNVDKIEYVQHVRRQKLGGYTAHTYVETVTIADDNNWVAYYVDKGYEEILNGQGKRT